MSHDVNRRAFFTIIAAAFTGQPVVAVTPTQMLKTETLQVPVQLRRLESGYARMGSAEFNRSLSRVIRETRRYLNAPAGARQWSEAVQRWISQPVSPCGSFPSAARRG